MESFSVRPIVEADNRELAAVIRSVLEEHGVNRPGTVYTDPTTDKISELLLTPKTDYWVVESGKKIVGGCGIYPTEGLPEGCVELVKLYILKEYRGFGLGKKLILRSIERAKELGYKSIYLETMPELAQAVGLYESLGFKTLPCRLGESGHFACHLWMLKELEA